MCGITAIINGCFDLSKARQALETLKHRGPDAHGQWLSSCGRIWLGHRRLSIVDLSENGNQPLCNEDGTVWLVCNGEIYNYPSLRSRLESLGHIFRSQSDNEVVIHAYEAWGEQCVDYFEGMFAFVLWDDSNKRLLAARDRIGIKPLCYHYSNDVLYFASELQGLLPLFPAQPSLEPISLAYYMTLGYIPAPWSIWHGVEKLEAGHLLTWQEDKGMRLRKYWEPPRYIDHSQQFDSKKISELFESVMQEHLLSDVPIGLFLSGGIDSSALAVALCEIGCPTQSLTLSYPGSVHDEAPLAKKVAEHLGLRHQEIPLTLTNVDKLIRDTATSYDEPQGYSALLSMYLVCKAASKNFKVVFGGDGGDEIFGGYNWYRGIGEHLPSTIRGRLHNCVRPLGLFSKKRTLSWSKFAGRSPLHRHASRIYPRFFPVEVEKILSPMGIVFGEDEMLAPLQKHFEPALPPRRAFQRVDLMTFCSDSILPKVDRASMAHSLEVRVPFLDRRFVEWTLTLPVSDREAIEGKPLLRDYLRGRVPASVLEHPKQGFSLRVLDNYDWDTAIELIRKGLLVNQGYLSTKWEETMKPGSVYREGKIWNLLMLNHWATNFLS